ncbi:MAG: hypothetical protein RLZ97_1416, partial [Verrucomicrobiota bacterium]
MKLAARKQFTEVMPSEHTRDPGSAPPCRLGREERISDLPQLPSLGFCRSGILTQDSKVQSPIRNPAGDIGTAARLQLKHHFTEYLTTTLHFG